MGRPKFSRVCFIVDVFLNWGCLQLERRKEAERVGAVSEEDPRILPDDRGNYAIMHAIARGNNSMAALLDAYDPVVHHEAGCSCTYTSRHTQ